MAINMQYLCCHKLLRAKLPLHESGRYSRFTHDLMLHHQLAGSSHIVIHITAGLVTSCINSMGSCNENLHREKYNEKTIILIII